MRKALCMLLIAGIIAVAAIGAFTIVALNRNTDNPYHGATMVWRAGD